jgi:hypothetical protein
VAQTDQSNAWRSHELIRMPTGAGVTQLWLITERSLMARCIDKFRLPE